MNSDPSDFGGRLRVRVCGLLVESGSVLLVQLHSPVSNELVWTPPGGGLKFEESLEDCLIREFREETSLEIAVGDLIHINELITSPFHALEFYFEVERGSGETHMGKDPELPDEQQLLHRLRWIPIDEIGEISFVPPGLLKKLLQWDRRFDFSVLSG